MADQVRVNDVGDVVLEDVRQLRALADQDRLAVFTRLQRHGPADVAGLATELDRDRDVVAAALEQLAEAGLAEAPDGQWRAPGRGLFLQLPDGDPEAARAARQLSGVMLLAVADLPGSGSSRSNRSWTTRGPGPRGCSTLESPSRPTS